MLPARRLPEQAALFDRAEVRPVTLGPDLTAYDVILANLSGGKDSQTMLRVLVAAADAAGVRDRIVCVFADLGEADEWPGTAEMAAAHAAAYRLRIITVRREVTDPRTGRRKPPGLLERIYRRGMWPDARNRYCTSDLKRGPIRTVMTFLADEARGRGITGRRVRILNVLGMRAQESPSRRLMEPFAPDAGSSNKTRREVDQWLPIHAWTLEEVWADIRASGVPYHRVYDYGMPRLSCRFCILASESALVLAAQLDPAGAEARAAVERDFLRRKLATVCAVMMAAEAEGRLTPLLALALRRALRSGHKFQAARSMEQVIAKAKALPRPAIVDDWQG
jgi:3'-phosphoadenosine 5'-phosphosulfate sulfotransferase (PAPS reductase)/FAD synthetase